MSSAACQAIAYLLTWTTYGTWLRGDKRGYVGRTLDGDGSVRPANNEYGERYDADDGRTYNRDFDALKSQPVHLTAEQAACAAEALCEAARGAGYDLARAAVMRDHVHVLVGAHPDSKSEVMRKLKGVSAVRLTQRFGRPGGRWWTRSGSEREKWDGGAVAAAEAYVASQENKLAEIVSGRVVQILERRS
jgi:REP element-mobilizing transposase RayT